MQNFRRSDSSDNQPFTFRLWTPDDSDDERDGIGQLTIRLAYQQFVLPALENDDAAPNTIKAYENAIGHWERLMPLNPTLAQLDDQVMDDFRGKAKRDGNATTTCNKWFRHLGAILNRMGPRNSRDKRSRRNVRFFEEVPYLEVLEEKTPTPLQMKDSQINLLYTSADVATWPFKSRTGVEPAHWWKTSIVYLVNYAPRRDDWLFIPRANFDFESGEFHYTAKKTGKLHELVLSDVLSAHLELFPADRELMFSPTQAHKQLYDQWYLIQKAAGVSTPTGSPIEFQDLRRFGAQRYHKFAPMTASMLLGHSLPDEKSRVTKEWYIGKAWLEPLFEAIRTIPQPAAFRPLTEAYVARVKEAELAKSRRLKQEDPHQKHLFD